MINYLKKELRHIPFLLLITLFVYAIGTFATNYILDASDVTFNNTGTSISSNTVPGALSDVYSYVTDYSSLGSRFTTINNKIGTGNLTTTNQNLIAAANELKSIKASLDAPIFTGDVKIQKSAPVLYFHDVNDASLGTLYTTFYNNRNRMIMRVTEVGTSYYTNYWFPASDATTSTVDKYIITTAEVTSSHNYVVGDTINLPSYMFGYGASTTAIRFEVPVTKNITSSKVYTLTMGTISNIYKFDGTTVTATNASCTAARQNGGSSFYIQCGGLSGITIGAAYTLVMSGTKKIVIEEPAA